MYDLILKDVLFSVHNFVFKINLFLYYTIILTPVLV